MAASPSGKPGTYEDWVLAGDDIYGGLSVPMVVDWKDGRKLLVGWINGLDRYHEVPKGWNLQVWGGWLCFRELVQFPDGRLGTKWLAETPNRGETRVYENCAPECPFVLTFRNETGMTVEFRIDPQEGRAQFADDGNRKQTLSEVARGLDLTKGRRIVQIAAGHLNAPYTAQNYAIGKIRGLGCPFNVKFNLYYDAKAAGTVFDAEIAGARTMVARYPGKYEMCAKETAAVNEPKISVFASFIRKVAKERGVSKTAAAAMLHSIGIRGFDAGPDEEDLEELAATKLRPINFYYSPDWLGRAGDKRYWSDKATPSECLAQAQRFGIPRIMVVPPDFTDGKENPAEFEKILEHMRSFVAEAGKLGIVVTVEDYGGNANCCSYAKYLKRMLAEIPDLKFALDSGNLYYAGRGEDILELMTFATGRIGHVHLKDQQTENSRSYVTLGLGAVPNEKIVKAVAATGYDGWYTLENPVGDTYNDTVRQAAVLRTWLSADGAEGVE